MFRWIVDKSLTFRFIVLAIGVGLALYGVDRIHDMPVDVFPEFAPPRVEIQTPALGLAPDEVEALITVPLEEALSGVVGLDVMRSRSVPQLSSIEMIFKPGTNLVLARQMVQERIAQVSPFLPSWAGLPHMLQPLSATSRVLKIGLSSETHDLMELSMLAYWKIRERLLGVPGVAHVAIWGERLQMLQVQVDPERLRAYDVTLDEIMETTADAINVGLLRYSDGAVIGTGGFIDTPNQRLRIRHLLPILSPEQLGQAVVKVDEEGNPLQLGEVALMTEDHQPLIGDAIINDGPGLLLIVEKFPWGNTLEITRGIEAALASLRPGLPDIDIDHEIFRPATFIEMSIDNLSRALLIGAVLVAVVLLFFLYEWRIALISLVAIPLSLIAAALVLYFMDATINVMVLAGFVIALGAVVDDAIIDVENIVRRLRQHRKARQDAQEQGTEVAVHKSTARVILEASVEVRGAIVYATLIEVLALLPVFFMEGLSGSFFKPLALAYSLAVMASLVVALTVTPALSLLLLAKTSLERRESHLVRWLHKAYGGLIAKIIRAPRFAYATVGMFVAAGLLILPQMGQELLPSFKERDFLMHWLAKPGTSLPEMNRITIQASKELREIPGVRNFGAHIGQALHMDEVVGIYFGENWVSVDPAVDYDDTVNRIQTAVDGYPGLFRDVLTYLKERIREVLTGSSEAIVVRIYGPELAVLRDKAHEVRDAFANIEGIIDLHVELQTEISQIDIEVDLVKAQQYGIKPGDVRRAATTLLASVEVGDIHGANRTWDVQVWSTPETRNSLTSVHELLIDTPSGDHVRLGEVAEVSIVPAPNVIKREMMTRRIDVDANVRGRDLGSVVADVNRALSQIEFPLEYRAELLGEYAELQAASQGLLLFSLIAVAGIFLMLQTVFKSWRLAVMAFLTLPAAMVGGILAAYFGNGVISLGSLVGFLTVLGIAARNGIMLITHYQHLEQFEGEVFGHALIQRGSRERVAPIMMTALTTGLALVPLAIAGNLPGHEIEHPMALVILGGLVTSTLLNLFVVPALYVRFGKPKTHLSSN